MGWEGGSGAAQGKRNLEAGFDRHRRGAYALDACHRFSERVDDSAVDHGASDRNRRLCRCRAPGGTRNSRRFVAASRDNDE